MTLYPNSIDDSTTLPPATGDDAVSVNASIAAIEAIETELGILPSGVYASVRTRLDILEARVNNPYSPYPTVVNPFYIGTTGVSIRAGIGDPNVLQLLAVPGSLYLRQDGYSDALYSFRGDGYWLLITNGSITPPPVEIVFTSGSNVTNSATPVRIGGRDLNMGNYPVPLGGSLALSFIALLEVSTTSSATAQIQLWDTTDNVLITSGTTTLSNGLVVFTTPLITGVTPGTIRTDIAPVYEVRLALSASGNYQTDYAICTSARISISYQ